MRLARFISLALIVGPLALLILAPSERALGQAANPNTIAPPNSRLDLYGDPLPPGAIARLGTTRLRERQMATSVAFSPDGKTIASAGWSGNVSIWDLRDGKLLKRFSGTRSGVLCVAFSPDGTKIGAGGDQGQVYVWNLASGELLLEVKANQGRTEGISFSASGRIASVGGSDSILRIFSAESDKPLVELDIPNVRQLDEAAVAISLDGKRVATGGRGGGITIWNLDDPLNPVIITKAHQSMVTSLAFDVDSRTLLSGGVLNRTIANAAGKRLGYSYAELRAWDSTTGIKTRDFTDGTSELGLGGMACARDGKHVVLTHNRGLSLYNLQTGQLIRTIERPWRTLGPRSQSAALSPDGSLVAEAYFDNKIYVWNTATGEPVLPQFETHTDSVKAADFSPVGEVVATVSADSTTRTWDARSGKQIRKFEVSNGWGRSVDFDSAGLRLLAGAEHFDSPGFSGRVKLFDLATGEELWTLATPDRVTVTAVSDDRLAVIAMGLGPNFASPNPQGGRPGCPIQVWDLATNQQLCELPGHESRVLAVASLPDQKTLVSIGEDLAIRRWNLQTKALIDSTPIVGHGSNVPDRTTTRLHAAAISADVKLAATTCAMSDEIVAWDLEKLNALRTLTIPGLRDASVAISRDNRWLAAGYLLKDGEGAGIQLWDLSTGAKGVHFDLPDRARATALAFSRDGSLLVSGLDDGSSLVWQLAK